MAVDATASSASASSGPARPPSPPVVAADDLPPPPPGRPRRRRRLPPAVGASLALLLVAAVEGGLGLAPTAAALSTPSGSPPGRPRRTTVKVRSAKAASTLGATRTRRKSNAKTEAGGEGEAADEVPDDEPPRPKYYARKPDAAAASGAPWQHQEMMDHAVLTKEEEVLYGRRVVRARELREKVEALAEERRIEREESRAELERERAKLGRRNGDGEEALVGASIDSDFLNHELEYLSVYGFRPSSTDLLDEGLDQDDDLLFEHARHRRRHASQLESDYERFRPAEDGTKRRTNPKPAMGTAERNSYAPLLGLPLSDITEADVVEALGVPGGKSELVEALLEGARARETLMRRNVKLVMSVAKGWMRNGPGSPSNRGADGLGSGNGDGGPSSSRAADARNFKGRRDKSSNFHLSKLYEGSWDRPSLDEAVQEGCLGLARAVDRYDPERGLRFSTYATHWITSYVRTCFRRAKTGCLYVPSQLHDVKASYGRIVGDALGSGGEVPPKSAVAEELGISEKRLNMAIRATGTLLSVDAPLGGGKSKGSAAGLGGAGGDSRELLLLDTLRCPELRPEDQVETSFLRQCLENAMAAELTPYERDVLRLRLGLDGGKGMTVRRVAELSGGSATIAEVRSAERRAFKKLRSPGSVHARDLMAYLDWTADR